MKSFRNRRLLLVAVATVVAAFARPATAHDFYAVRGPWIDDTSKTYAMEDLRGTFTVATMAYGACQRVCSTSVRFIRELHALAERNRVAVNFVVFGLDPEQDKPSDWAAMRTEQHLGFANIRFLSGSAASTRRAAEWLGIRYWRYGEHTMHDFRIVLVGPDGAIVRAVEHFDADLTGLLPR